MQDWQPEFQLELKDICKRYGNMQVNDAISLQLRRASIHALLGENGAGKSTLVNILYGLVKPDQGSIYWQGKSVNITSPKVAKALGIGIVFQHFALFENLSVTENLALGMHYRGSLATLRQRITQTAAKYNLQIDAQAQVATLSVGQKQRVEILRCLMQSLQLLILDEPTSVLTEVEVESLFTTLRQLRDDGISVLFIGHRLAEIKAICDTATILRNGKKVADCTLADVSVAEITRLMIGRAVQPLAETKPSQQDVGRVCLRLRIADTGDNYLKVDSLELKTAHILGIAGIAGNGQNELLDVLSGETRADAVSLTFEGKEISTWRIRKRNEAGLLFVPTERLGRSATLNMSLYDNALLSVSTLAQFVRRGLVRSQPMRRFSEQIIDEFNVKTSGYKDLAGRLSGGNLQKFIVGRAVLQQPKVLIIANPTWGVDVKSALFIRHKLLQLRHQGVAILVASEDLQELLQICDELAVIRQGQLSNVFQHSDFDRQKIAQLMVH